MTAPAKPEKRAPRPRKQIARTPLKRGTKRIDRKTRPAKKRKTPMGKLLRTLRDKFHTYVKQRDGNTCFSCGRSGLEGLGWHAGHFLSAGKYGVIRYEPKNVHSQCYYCNINLRGNGGAYALAIIETYGVEELQRLQRKRREIKQWKRYEVEEMIAALDKGGADYECLYAERYGLPGQVYIPAPETVPTTNEGGAL